VQYLTAEDGTSMPREYIANGELYRSPSCMHAAIMTSRCIVIGALIKDYACMLVESLPVIL
jgi:hypothetical protein